MTEAVLDLLRRNLADAEGDAERIRQAIRELEGNGSSKRRRRAARPAKRDAVPAGRILKAVKDTDGMTTTTLAKQLDGDQAQILERLKEMEAGGKVKRTGERRATRWHLAA